MACAELHQCIGRVGTEDVVLTRNLIIRVAGFCSLVSFRVVLHIEQKCVAWNSHGEIGRRPEQLVFETPGDMLGIYQPEKTFDETSRLVNGYFASPNLGHQDFLEHSHT